MVDYWFLDDENSDTTFMMLAPTIKRKEEQLMTSELLTWHVILKALMICCDCLCYKMPKP
jgi:hypothetical protein